MSQQGQQVQLTNMGSIPDRKGGVDNPTFKADEAQYSNVKEEEVNIHVDDGPRHRNNTNGGRKPAQDLDDDSDLNACAKGVNVAQRGVINFLKENKAIIIRGFLVILFLLYMAYVVYAMTKHFGDEGSVRLLVCTLFGVFLLVINLSWDFLASCCKSVSPDITAQNGKKARTIIKWVLYVVSVICMVTLLVVLVALDTPGNLISLGGLAAFILLAWITSVNPARVNWHPVFWGLSMQFYFAVIILRTRWGYDAFKWLGDRVTEFLMYANEGAAFVFGDNFRVHFFAFAILPVIVFFSAVISVLYHLGVMQAIVRVFGRFLSFCMGTTPAESLNAAANIFVGMTEAPLMIRPFIGKMTKSELHAVMTGGFATIAGSVLGAYIGFGVPANHLLSASVMSAPAALAISKLTYPETEEPQISDDDYKKMEVGEEGNLIEAASAGASGSIVLVANVAVNVMAFLSILKFVNATLTWFGDRVDVEGLSFQLICSYVLYPVAMFMGTEPGLDCRRIGELVGIKTFTNEFIAYGALQKLLNNRKQWANYSSFYDVNDPVNIMYDDMDITLTQWNETLKNGFLSPRSEVIATYALCGFSNFGSMGILLGSMGAMAPQRKHDMASIVLRAMIAGNIACFFTACIAGLFFEDFE